MEARCSSKPGNPEENAAFIQDIYNHVVAYLYVHNCIAKFI